MQYYSREKRELKIIAAFSFILMMIVYGIAYFSRLLPNRPLDIFAKYDNLLLPHFYTIGLWVVLCFFLLYFVLFQSGRPGYGAKKDAIETVTPFFSVTCFLAAAWMVLWCYDIIWATVLIALGMVLMLNIAYFRLERIRPYLYQDEKKGVISPISFFLAFMTNMSVLNTAVFFRFMQWNYFGIPRAVMAVIGILLLVVINTAYIMLRRNFFFSFVAFVLMAGIGAGRFLEGEIMPVGYIAGLGALFLLIITLNSKRKNVNKG